MSVNTNKIKGKREKNNSKCETKIFLMKSNNIRFDRNLFTGEPFRSIDFDIVVILVINHKIKRKFFDYLSISKLSLM